ncbi:MAG: ABC transporter substrate-binding protein [Syntrophorhabdales bacterium]|jgi:branched-chain amino acid transport system substrate-binding protein
MENRKSWSFVIHSAVVVVLAVLFLATMCFQPAEAAEAQTLKIGGLFGLTGFFSGFDQVQAQEAQIAADMINEGGGIKVKGKPYNIQLIAYDFKSTMDGVAAGANKLIFQDGVKFMIAPSAFFSPPTKDIAESNKVIRGLTFITGTPQELSAGMNYTFLCHNSAFEHALWSIKYLKQAYPKVKSVAFLYPDDGTQAYVFGKEKAYLTQAGYSVVGDMITFANETADFSPIAMKIVAAKPDAIFMGNGTPPHAGNLLKAVRQLGSDLPFVYSGDTAPTDIIAIAGANAANNFFGPGTYKGAPNTPPLMQKIIDRIYAKYGERSIHMQAINVLYAFKQAIEKADSLDTTVVKNAWEKMDTMEFPPGKAKLGGLKTYGIKHAYSHPDEIWTLVNGKPVFGAWVDESPMP